ncbi:MAG: type II secretion system minor pseudopilin GspJ [Gammaproteobacteria bacterium]|nr:type II secretion system minor pseudopilin GspJ [Gammaproteobacteria bacterium]
MWLIKHNQTTENFTQKGFTLIELLIAIAVFAVMSVMAYGGLSQIIENGKHAKIELERLQSVQRAVTTISRDFSQIIKRDIRDEYGNTQPFLDASSNLDYLIEFTRSGRRNPAKLKRSNLLRVAYQLDDGKLIRLFWPQLDRAQGMEAYESDLLDQIEQVEFHYRDDKKEWHSEWPPLSSSGTTAELTAIELTLKLKDWGEITRIYQVSL